jgi:hypothetical protein
MGFNTRCHLLGGDTVGRRFSWGTAHAFRNFVELPQRLKMPHCPIRCTFIVRKCFSLRSPADTTWRAQYRTDPQDGSKKHLLPAMPTENQANSILQGGTLRGQVREIVRDMVLLETPYNGGGNSCA